MQLRTFFLLGLVPFVTSYLVQTKPSKPLRLQVTSQNNMLPPKGQHEKHSNHRNLVLDVQCQRGETTKRLEDIFFNHKVIGLDKDEDSIEMARKNFPESDFSCVDFDCSIFPKYSMKDSCYFINVNSYQNLDLTLFKCHFLLQDGGRCVLPLKTNMDTIQQALESYNLQDKLVIRRHSKMVEFVKH